MFVSKRTLRQGMSIFPNSMINLSFGLMFGWLAPATQYLKAEKASFSVSDVELSWIVSAFFATEAVFSVLNGLFTKRLGRKPMLLFSAFLQAIGWLMTVFANSATMLILSRVIHGISAGTYDVIWCMYIGEVTSPVERGVFGSILVSLFLGGIMIEFFLSLWLPFVWLSIIPAIISTFAFLGNFFVQETPFYLTQEGKYDEAIRNLAWLRGKDDPKLVQTEFDEMKRYLEEDANRKYGLMHVLRHPSEYKVVIVGILIFALAQPSGNIAILTYQTMLYDLYDVAKPGASFTVMYGVVQFAFINAAPFVIEKIGRKKPMIFGFGFTSIIHVILAYLFYMAEFQNKSIPYFSWIICSLFTLYGIVFVMTIMPTVYVLKSELFPQEVKSLANCAATMTNAGVDFVIVKLFVWIWSTFGLYTNFVLYAIICILSVVYVQILIPETRGKTLVEIQDEVQGKSQAVKKISTQGAADVSKVRV